MAYAGPVGSDDIIRAFKSAGANEIHYAQGVAFACEARALAHHVPVFTDQAARTVWGHETDALSKLVCEARDCLPDGDGDPPRYELWRRGVAAAFLHVPRDDR